MLLQPQSKARAWYDFRKTRILQFAQKRNYFRYCLQKRKKILCMKNLSVLNEIYNMQDSILLCKIFENRATEIMKECPYDPCKSTSTSLLSGCFHRFLSKAIISLTICAKHVELFEKTLIGGFSCVTARLAFDSSTLFWRDEDGKFRKDLKLI